MPRRSIQAKKREIMLWADVSNEKTIESHIKHLCGVGLLVRTGSLGDNKGQFYEVFTPEELGLKGDPTPAHPQPTPGQKLASPQAQKLPPGGLGQTVDSAETSGNFKTSFKTNTENDDDEALAPLVAQLRQAVKEITGREPSPAEAERWRELGELLVTELKIAAGRTQVSSVPAFLAEHLRRRLWKKEKRQVEEEGRSGVGSLESEVKIDASQCPDCFGTGMWYPEGFERGVARCEHRQLRKE